MLDALMQKKIHAAADLLRAGETVAFPTETVYGLGADASNPVAIEKIFTIKGRPADHPLIVHIADVTQLELYVEKIPRSVWRLSARFWPGPLTLILPRRSDVPNQVTGGQDTVGVRVPDHPVATSLLKTFGRGVAAPSANPFGRVSPTTAEHVRAGLGSGVGMILDGGPCRVGVESTILSLDEKSAVLLRPGGISVAEIEETLGRHVLPGYSREPRLRSPGSMPSHYAPVTPLEVHPNATLWHRVFQILSQGGKVAVLNLGKTGEKLECGSVNAVSMPLTAFEYGQALYSTLHHLDREGFDRILLEAPPDLPEWLAVNDRIRRASQTSSLEREAAQ